MKRNLTVILVGTVALLVGATVGPTVAQAASTQLFRLQGGGSAHVAKVSGKGQLSVTDGTAHTKTGQLLATIASPSQAVMKQGLATCAAGGYYTVPTGKALIITSIVFYNHPSGAGADEQDLTIGPASQPCTSLIAAGISNGEHVSSMQTFNPGINVPAGDALGGSSSNDGGSWMIYGYLVPATAVPHAKLAPAHYGPRGSATARR